MTRKNRTIARFAAAVGMTTAVLFGASTPALAGYQVLERAGCLWTAGSYKGYAYTKRSSGVNDCNGHGWVRIMLNGSTSYSGWTHSADVFDGARQGAPSGRHIIKSQHKTCSDCGAVTLTP